MDGKRAVSKVAYFFDSPLCTGRTPAYLVYAFFTPLPRIRDDRIACELAEYDRIDDGVSAQAVRTVYASGDFTRRIQTGNNFAVRADNVSARVDRNAAHRVVNAGLARSGNPRTLRQLRRIERSAEFVAAGIDARIERVDRRLERRSVHAEFSGKLFERIARVDIAVRFEIVERKSVGTSP